MEETPKLRPLDAGTFDPKRWLGAVVGGVVLGEALWSMLQLLIRDGATPAVMNLLGQGPTQNREAFLPQPLLLAFVEVCLAGILLVLILAWTNRGRRVLRVSVARAASTKERTPAVPTPVASPPIVPSPALVPPATSVREQTPLTVPQPVTRLEAALTETEPPAAFSPAPESVPTATLFVTPPVAAPVAPKPAESAQAKPKTKPKKPKPVYYNIVGEPIESDEE